MSSKRGVGRGVRKSRKGHGELDWKPTNEVVI